VNKTFHNKINSLGKEKQQNFQVFFVPVSWLCFIKTQSNITNNCRREKIKYSLLENSQNPSANNNFGRISILWKKSTFITKPLLNFTTKKLDSLIHSRKFVLHSHYSYYFPSLGAFKDVTIVRRNGHEVGSCRSGNGQQCYKPDILETQRMFNWFTRVYKLYWNFKVYYWRIFDLHTTTRR